MAKIETTLPTVAFGNVKVTFTPEELGVDISDAAAIGVATAVYLNLFTQGFKTGAQMDVSAPVSAPQGALGPEPRTINEILSDEDVDTMAEAQAILDKELGGVTEISDEEFEQKAAAAEVEMGVAAEMTDELGFPSGNAPTKAPWNQSPTVDGKRKPWETENLPPEAVVTAPAVLDASW